jgi:hypothetical protein
MVGVVMTYFPDLANCTYGSDDEQRPKQMLSIGWLEPPHPIPTGTVPDEFVTRLGELCAQPVAVTRGYHDCPFPPCRDTDQTATITDINGRPIFLGNAEIWVSSSDHTWYAAPTMIYHYVTEHRYRPPDEFIDAVLAGRGD